jgi:hypothetical protein
VRRSLIALAVFSILLGACGGGTKTASKATTTTDASGASTTQAATAASTTTTAPGPGSTVKPTGAVDPGGYGWAASATDYRGLNGKQLEFGCPPGGRFAAVYGNGTYTDDSSVCTAAVHAGKITQAAGGQVVIAIQPGQPTYAASQANGVDSAGFGKYEGSYEIVSNLPFKGTTDPQTGGYGWKITANALRGLIGQRFTFSCPPAGELSAVYGTGTYTDDSSVCVAAVHAGKVALAAGGKAVIEMKGEQTSFTGSEANGVKSNDYGAWPASYSFAS